MSCFVEDVEEGSNEEQGQEQKGYVLYELHGFVGLIVVVLINLHFKCVFGEGLFSLLRLEVGQRDSDVVEANLIIVVFDL